MGQVIVEVCRRCHAPLDKGPKWAQNAQKDWLHQCEDGVMGGLVEVAESELKSLKPLKLQKFIKPDGCVFFAEEKERAEIKPNVFANKLVTRMRVRCPLCDQPVWGDKSAGEAIKSKHNLFQCECGEWQEYLLNINGDWVLFDYSKTPMQEVPPPSGCQHEWEKEDPQIDKQIGFLEKFQDIRNRAETTKKLYPPALMKIPPSYRGRPIPEIPPKPSDLAFNKAAIVDAMREPATCRVPFQRCASCGGSMSCLLFANKINGVDHKLPTILVGPNLVQEFHVAYFCQSADCCRMDLYGLKKTASRGIPAWFEEFEHIAGVHPNNFDLISHMREPNAILEVEPIIAVKSSSSQNLHPF